MCVQAYVCMSSLEEQMNGMQFVYEFSIKVTDLQEKFDALKLHMQMKTLKLGYCSLIIELIYHLAYVYIHKVFLTGD